MIETIKKIENIYYLQIGVQGENIANAIQMDISSWRSEFPNAGFHILFKRYNENVAYPVATELTDNILTWYPTVTDTEVTGVGYVEVRATDQTTGLVKKSRIIPTSVENSVSGMSSPVPDPFDDWLNQLLALEDVVKGYKNQTIVYHDQTAVLKNETQDIRDDAESQKEAAQTAAELSAQYLSDILASVRYALSSDVTLVKFEMGLDGHLIMYITDESPYRFTLEDGRLIYNG